MIIPISGSLNSSLSSNPLGGTFTMDEEVILRNSVHSMPRRVNCEQQYYVVQEITEAPSGLPEFNRGRYIYPTNLSGLVARISQGYRERKISGPYNSAYSGVGVKIDFELVTTGINQLSSGILNGDSLPSGIVYVTESPAGEMDESAKIIARYSYSGSLTISNPTCNVDNKDVFLGNYHGDDFDGVGSATPWVDTSLIIVCSGGFNGSQVSIAGRPEYNAESGSWEGGAFNGEGAGTTNKPYVVINPVYGYAQGQNSFGGQWGDSGVIGINNISEDAASGIGIELAFSSRYNNGAQLQKSDISGVEGLLAYSSDIEIGSNVVKIPLFARYIKTAPSMSAGRADSKVIYTLNYK
ncbi:TPA: hypothetical protein QH438_005717 [Klebsiella michiganensis]|nr:hypothetical protein [Klebsiella michiganensis]